MNKFDLVFIDELTKGDRFYFPNKKNLLYTFAGKLKHGIKKEYCYEDDNGNYINTEYNKKVVFLRHTF